MRNAELNQNKTVGQPNIRFSPTYLLDLRAEELSSGITLQCCTDKYRVYLFVCRNIGNLLNSLVDVRLVNVAY